MTSVIANAFRDPHSLASVVAWLGAICTLGIYTFLYRENVIYRAFEHFYLGLAVGYGMFLVITQILDPKWFQPMWAGGQWWWAFALVAGSMFYFIYSKKHNWISRLMFGALMGLSAGTMFQDFAGTNFPKIAASFKAIVPHSSYWVPDTLAKSVQPAQPQAALTWAGAVNNAIFIFVLVAVMSYFFFSFDYTQHKKANRMAKTGRWMLMFAFGAMFGATVMARMSLLIGRVWFLLFNWLKLVRM